MATQEMHEITPSAEGQERPEASFRPVRTGKISDDIRRQLETAIFNGQFKPGDRLPPERVLVERFAASRSSVREALRSLQSGGLVTVRPGSGGGAYVAAPYVELMNSTLWAILKTNHIDERELYQARLLLEPGIAEMAARRVTEADLALLRAAIQERQQLQLSGQATAGASHNFHLLMAEASGSKLLGVLMSSLMELANRTAEHRRPARSSSPHIVHAHERIVDALARGDGDLARRLTHEHVLELMAEIGVAP
ncbi:MAG: FadR family transcriptional regulator [Chloroflexota bacterium]|nr:FadR family transcriptional regulator [Chloroflexota bacterium]